MTLELKCEKIRLTLRKQLNNLEVMQTIQLQEFNASVEAFYERDDVLGFHTNEE